VLQLRKDVHGQFFRCHEKHLKIKLGAEEF